MTTLAISQKFSVVVNLLMYYNKGQQAKVISLLQKLKPLSDVKAFPKFITIGRSKKKEEEKKKSEKFCEYYISLY